MPALPIDLRRLAERVGAWLASTGPESDVVLSCRVRLARNVEGHPFVARLDARQAEELCARLRDELHAARLDGETLWVGMGEASPLLRVVLRERHLISRDLSPSEDGQGALPGRGVAFGASESVAAMVNEEDHLRLQALSSGFDLDRAWGRAQELDRWLETRVPFAHSRALGYLTGCPTNVGTGLRASVMMHLPALSLVRPELEKVFAAAQRTGLAVRGMYGEGSRAAGDLYQISNQVTLGRSEVQLLDDLKALVPAIVRFERQLRQLLLQERRTALLDRIQRSQGLLRTARAMQTEAALAHLSQLRLGIELGLSEGPRLPLLNQLAVQVQKGHVQALAAEDPGTTLLEASERDRLRASLLRARLAARP
jgi:protein arginine kinase